MLFCGVVPRITVTGYAPPRRAPLSEMIRSGKRGVISSSSPAGSVGRYARERHRWCSVFPTYFELATSVIPMTVALSASKLGIIKVEFDQQNGDTLWEACNVDYATLFDRRYYETAAGYCIETSEVTAAIFPRREFAASGLNHEVILCNLHTGSNAFY